MSQQCDVCNLNAAAGDFLANMPFFTIKIFFPGALSNYFYGINYKKFK